MFAREKGELCSPVKWRIMEEEARKADAADNGSDENINDENDSYVEASDEKASDEEIAGGEVSDEKGFDAKGISVIDTDGKTSDEKGSDSDRKDKGSEKTRMELYDWLQCIVTAILCGIFIFVFVGRTIGVEGDSMRDTLHWYDRVIMSNLFYTPTNGDIVIFRSPNESFGGTPLVKRVIATEGQTVDIDFETNEVFVDGVVLVEPYIRQPTRNRIDFVGPVTVPEGHVFVMGDNRNASADSRDSRVGMVDTRYILGKVLFLAIPGGTNDEPRDWSRFGLIPG